MKNVHVEWPNMQKEKCAHTHTHGKRTKPTNGRPMWASMRVRVCVCTINALDRQQIANQTRNKVISSFFHSIARLYVG